MLEKLWADSGINEESLSEFNEDNYMYVEEGEEPH